MSLFIGVEGGNIRSTAIACDEHAKFVGGASGTCLAYRWTNSFSDSLGNILRALSEQAGLSFGALLKDSGRIALALSGIVGTNDESLVRAKAYALGIRPDQLSVTEDVRACFPANGLTTGIVVWASSGAVVVARRICNNEVQYTHVDGWGPIIGDTGGGFDLGTRALESILSASDGRSDACADLAKRVLTHLRLCSISEVLGWFDQSRISPEWRQQVSALAEPIVLAAEHDRDPVARRILSAGASSIVESFRAAYRSLTRYDEMAQLDVVLEGGLFEHSATYLHEVSREIRETCPPVNPKYAAAKPVIGAVCLALEETGFTLTDAIRSTLIEDAEALGLRARNRSPLRELL